MLAGCVLMLLLCAPGCKHEPGAAPDTTIADNGLCAIPIDTTPISTCNADTVYFQQQILPLVNSYCASTGCHNAIAHAFGVRLDEYSRIMVFVSPGFPAASDLVLTVQSTYMPPSTWPQMSAAQLNLIITWIQQGALNNTCNGGCDPTNVTYHASVKPVFQTACYGCHSGNNTSGNFNITTWAACNAASTNGTLCGDILDQAGHHLMPPAPSAISPCDRNRILRWIHQGAPDN